MNPREPRFDWLTLIMEAAILLGGLAMAVPLAAVVWAVGP